MISEPRDRATLLAAAILNLFAARALDLAGPIARAAADSVAAAEAGRLPPPISGLTRPYFAAIALLLVAVTNGAASNLTATPLVAIWPIPLAAGLLLLATTEIVRRRHRARLTAAVARARATDEVREAFDRLASAIRQVKVELARRRAAERAGDR